MFRDSLRLWKYLDQEIVASVEMLTTGSCKLSTYQMDAIALIWDWWWRGNRRQQAALWHHCCTELPWPLCHKSSYNCCLRSQVWVTLWRGGDTGHCTISGGPCAVSGRDHHHNKIGLHNNSTASLTRTWRRRKEEKDSHVSWLIGGQAAAGQGVCSHWPAIHTALLSTYFGNTGTHNNP